ncbi:hypothetical protein [Burkholderia pseudomallei]|uniref:hypothetical protein n=1 Tax=Burkholderia pseudomallei TaxID=28450 RepID=UPI002AB34558|nr:hypothetical protein [Burkholderia pseudomallei]MDY7779527.1 hypothetical protein [Burkholderia pseudomallei]MDY7812360.1 hypothetical protein [Burkholderia pseudomallei]
MSEVVFRSPPFSVVSVNKVFQIQLGSDSMGEPYPSEGDAKKSIEKLMVFARKKKTVICSDPPINADERFSSAASDGMEP